MIPPTPRYFPIGRFGTVQLVVKLSSTRLQMEGRMLGGVLPTPHWKIDAGMQAIAWKNTED